MKNKSIIVIPAHITNDTQLSTLKRCVESIRKFSDYPIFLSLSGDIKFVEYALTFVDHYIFTSVNTLLTIDSGLDVFYRTDTWMISEHIPAPRKYHSFAHLQKICLGLGGAISLGYEHFLVINYDALIMDAGFINYMFSEENSIVFTYSNTEFTNMDVLKLNKEFACKVNTLNDYETYKNLSSTITSELFEEVFTKFMRSSGCYIRELEATPGTAYQLKQFKVLINSMSSSDASAVLVNGKINLLVTSQGSPAHTLNNRLEIKHGEASIVVPVDHPTSMLLPVCDYEGKDVHMSVVTSFGEFPLIVRKETLENTKLELFNN